MRFKMTIFVCTLLLLSHTSQGFSVSERIVMYTSDIPSYTYAGSPLRIAETPTGFVVSWHEYGGSKHPYRAHLTRFRMNGTKEGPDILIDGVYPIQGLLCDQDGYVILGSFVDSTARDGKREGACMRFLRVSWDGTLLSNKVVIGPERVTGVGGLINSGINRLHRCKGGYAAYTYNSKDGHQGDGLIYLDADGDRLPGGWKWGVSHSLEDQHLAIGSQYTYAAALSDAHPGRGLFFSVGTHPLKNSPHIKLSDWKDSNNDGKLDGFWSIGGLRPLSNGTAWLFYCGPMGSTALEKSDIFLTHLKPDGSFSTKNISNTPTDIESFPLLGFYSGDLLAIWSRKSDMHFARINQHGTIMEQSAARINAETGIYVAPDATTLASFSNGDVLWVYAVFDQWHVSRLRALPGYLSKSEYTGFGGGIPASGLPQRDFTSGTVNPGDEAGPLGPQIVIKLDNNNT